MLVVSLLLALNCGYQSPQTKYRGVSMWRESGPPISNSDFRIGIDFMMQKWWEFYEQPTRSSFKRQPLHIFFVKEKFACGGAELCAGLTDGWGNTSKIAVSNSCLADSAFLHELAHALSLRKWGDADASHDRDPALWDWADSTGPEELRTLLKGCAHENNETLARPHP